MALIKCPECGADVSENATVCPKCGEKMPKKTSLFTWMVAALILIGVGISLTKPDAPPPPKKTPEQLAAEIKREAEFQRVVRVAKLVKASAKNPASFTLTFAGLTNQGAICIEYRATNSFNAVVPGNYVVAGATAGDSPALWNKHCANQRLTDYSFARQAL